jgi:hypothetical protein
MSILAEGYASAVRSRLGVDESDLSDEDITKTAFSRIAELQISKKVPEYKSITDEADLFYLEEAALNYVCYLLCPIMALKVNVEVKTLDTAWKKAKVDWDALADMFLTRYLLAVESIETVEVVTYSSTIVGLISHDYEPIGGE